MEKSCNNCAHFFVCGFLDKKLCSNWIPNGRDIDLLRKELEDAKAEVKRLKDKYEPEKYKFNEISVEEGRKYIASTPTKVFEIREEGWCVVVFMGDRRIEVEAEKKFKELCTELNEREREKK